ncbi:unnamed protein product [marine sediment metagenome]|uniref:Uncharacterized protein n=1 Tax=marine sediment metagenome TaxID=412755 RepID=X1GN75_9ZZZZ
MNVKILKQRLEQFKDTDNIILSSDAEGNSFSKISEIGYMKKGSSVFIFPEHSYLNDEEVDKEMEGDSK